MQTVRDKFSADLALLEAGDMKYFIMEAALRAAEKNEGLLRQVRASIIKGLRVRVAQITAFVTEDAAADASGQEAEFLGQHARRYQAALDGLERGEEVTLMDNMVSGIVIPATSDRNTEEIRFGLPIE